MAIADYAVSAGSNTTVSGINIAENCPPSGINDAIRQIMADLRVSANDGGWQSFGTGAGTPTYSYVSGTSFAVNSGAVDLTGVYAVGRRVRAVGSTTGTIFGTISGAIYVSPNTTVTVTWDAGALSNESLTVSIGVDRQQTPAPTGIVTLTAALNEAAFITIASAATTSIGAAASSNVRVTGTTAITAFDTIAAGARRKVVFAGALTLTHNAASLILPGAANITTAVGDSLEAVSLGGGNWRVERYTRANGQAVTVTSQIQSVTASVASNTLTIGLNPTSLDFRTTPLGSGTINTRSVASALSLTVPTAATLGTVNTVQSQIAVLAIDNAGTVELAVVNLAGGVDLSETGVISTTAISALATSASTIYSTTARTGVPYRVVGIVQSTQATAGTWANAPSLVQGVGGQAYAALQSLGVGQTWQNLVGSRALSTNYYNTTGRPISVTVSSNVNPNSQSITAVVNGVIAGYNVVPNTPSNAACGVSFIVPPGGVYSVLIANSTILFWSELR